MRKGFTLIELMIIMVVIGLIATFTLPILNKDVSMKTPILFKSSYKFVEKIVFTLISDDDLYATGNLALPLDSDSDANLAEEFCLSAANLVNIIGSETCTSGTSSYVTDTPNFKTSNGMVWWGFYDDFADGAIIYVDIDGTSKGSQAIDSDVYQINIDSTGKISVPSINAQNHLLNY